MRNYYLAIDIGASSGRHILGHLENGKMVLIGTCENVTSISATLYDSNDGSMTVNSLMTEGTIANGGFRVEIDLSKVTTGRPWNWYFIMVSVNGSDATNIVVPYDAASTMQIDDGRTFSFIDWQGGNTAVQYQ